jgi:heat shock protein HtpX
MFVAMSLIMMAVGFVVGMLMGQVLFGLLAMLLISVIFNVYAFVFSKKHALRANGARIVSEAEEPRLHAIVARVAEKAGIPKPEVGVTEEPMPNAFATGRGPKNAAVVATRGILRLLPDAELEGVIAHEISHVKNRDILVMSIASTMAAVLSYMAHYLLWMALSGRNRDWRITAMAVGLSVTVPIAAMLVQLGVSRNREFLADETGAKITGNPRALARALGSIEAGVMRPDNDYNKESYADMWISNPIRKKNMLSKLFRTHPPMDERIARLNAMADRMENGGSAAPSGRWSDAL